MTTQATTPAARLTVERLSLTRAGADRRWSVEVVTARTDGVTCRRWLLPHSTPSKDLAQSLMWKIADLGSIDPSYWVELDQPYTA